MNRSWAPVGLPSRLPGDETTGVDRPIYRRGSDVDGMIELISERVQSGFHLLLFRLPIREPFPVLFQDLGRRLLREIRVVQL